MASPRRKGLGRGLDALLGPGAEAGEGRGQRIPVEMIGRSPYQPRRRIDPDALDDLVRSIRAHGLTPVVEADTAGAAAAVAERGDGSRAAIASTLAAETYGLAVLAADIEDAGHNTTRFVVMAREPRRPRPGAAAITSFVFRVKNIPAALYKALGGFATNGVNMLKLESYILDGSFTAAQFYCDIAGHPDDPAIRRAFDELAFFSREVKVLGAYPADPLRAAAERSP